MNARDKVIYFRMTLEPNKVPNRMWVKTWEDIETQVNYDGREFMIGHCSNMNTWEIL